MFYDWTKVQLSLNEDEYPAASSATTRTVVRQDSQFDFQPAAIVPYPLF